MFLLFTYPWQLHEELDDVGDEPGQVTHDEDKDDDEGDPGEADVALAQTLLPAPPELLAERFVFTKRSVDQRVENGEDQRGQDEVNQPEKSDALQPQPSSNIPES